MKVIIDNEQFNRSLKRMTHEIIERNDNLSDIVLVGIEKKGTPIAREIKSFIKQFENDTIFFSMLNFFFSSRQFFF